MLDGLFPLFSVEAAVDPASVPVQVLVEVVEGGVDGLPDLHLRHRLVGLFYVTMEPAKHPFVDLFQLYIVRSRLRGDIQDSSVEPLKVVGHRLG